MRKIRRRTKGEGSIQEIGPNRFRIMLEGESLGDRRVRHSRTVTGTLDDARVVLDDLKTARRRNELVQRSDATVAMYLDAYLDRNPRRVAPRTLEGYRRLARVHVKPNLGRIRLQDLKRKHLVDLYERLHGTLSGSSVRQIHALISVTLADAVSRDILARNVAATVQHKPRGDRRSIPASILDAANMAKVIAAVRKTPLERVVLIAVLTGMRLGELLALRWASVDLAKREIVVCESVYELDDGTIATKKPKSGKARTIRVDQATANALDTQRREPARTLGVNPLVFPAPFDRFARQRVYPKGGLWSPEAVGGLFRRAMAKAKIAMRFHDLRHAHASLLLATGANLKEISQRLGHATVAFTLDVYAHLTPQTEIEAAERVGAALKRAMEA